MLDCYDLGQYQSHQGISAGVENTNYFVSTDACALILTVFEKHTFEELPFFLQLGEFLHRHHCKVPQPYRDRNGNFLQSVQGKPAVFTERLNGRHVQATQAHATEIAQVLADIHQATESFQTDHRHSHNRRWVEEHAVKVLPSLTESDRQLMTQALNRLQQLPDNLPCGVIHADLFHDNALFEQKQVTGIIDWYFAGLDSYALDIAITMNDWCLDRHDNFDPEQGEAFIRAYQRQRQLNRDELRAIPVLQIQSALRFWISRLIAQAEHGQSSDNITVKDPELMKQQLQHLLENRTQEHTG